MTWRTHMLAGAASVWLLAPLPHLLTAQNVSELCALAAFGALLPDLDAGESKIKSLSLYGVRPFAPLADSIHAAWGHRGLTHAPLGLGLFGLACLLPGLLWGLLPALAIWLGYASHLAADACTKSGIPRYADRLLPRIHLVPPRLRITTGSQAEETLLPLLALAVLLLLLSRLPRVGPPAPPVAPPASIVDAGARPSQASASP